MFVNAVMAVFSGVLAILAVLFALLRSGEIDYPTEKSKKLTVPKSAFTLNKEAYDAIGTSLFELEFAPLSIKVPDLKPLLLFFGKNARPDASNHSVALHFALSDSKSNASIPIGEKLYLLYDRKQTPARYVFSPSNQETPLWLEVVENKGNEAVVKISVKNEVGETITEPANNSSFTLPQKDFVRLSQNNWEIGKHRVDGTLLARQKVRWFGIDKFMDRHGGDEFQELQGKQRIDFGEGEEIYHTYIGVNDVLIWQNDHWLKVTPGKDSLGKNLMMVKKVDERMITFDLWDAEGKNKVTLNLLKSNEQWSPQNLQKDFKFVAARTRSQYVFEINGERVLLRPQDWLVSTETGWKKLSTPEEIDDYVNRKVIGPMFVFDGIVKKEDCQVLTGTVFSHNRAEMETIELAVPQACKNSTTVINIPDRKPEVEDKVAESQPPEPENPKSN